MRRMLKLLCVLCLVATTSGCGSLFHKFTGPKSLRNEWTTRTLDPVSTTYDKLGPVRAYGTSTIILGFVFNEGNEGYGLMMTEARQRYGEDVTTILYPMISYEYRGILYPIYGKIDTHYFGTAVVANEFTQDGADINQDVPPEPFNFFSLFFPGYY